MKGEDGEDGTDGGDGQDGLMEVGLYLEEAKSPNGLLAVELEILGMLNAR